MKARYQILSWTLLILVLGLILLDKLRDASTSADVPTNGVQADLAQIDLAKFFESNLLAPQEKLSDNAPNKNQFKEVSKEGLKAQTESPFSHPNIATGSTNVYYVRKDDTLWLIARAHNLDLYTLLSFNKLENPNLIRPGQAIKITR